MTDVRSIETANASLTREWLNVARYYLGNRWVLLALGSIVVIAGAALNWSWLVAVGLAPILLTMAPCAIMCAIGLCSMGGKKQSDQMSNGATAESSSALRTVKADEPSLANFSCCHEDTAETRSADVKQTQSVESQSAGERKESHA